MLLRIWIVGWLVLLSLVAPASVRAGRDHDGASAAPPLRVLVSEANGLTLELVTPHPRVTTVQGLDARDYVRIEVPGFVSSGAPGQPDLPAYNALLAVPPDAQWTVEVEILAATTIKLEAPVLPALEPGGQAFDVGAQDVSLVSAPATKAGFQREEWAYASTAFVPATLAEINEAGYFRDVRLARLMVAPVQYRAATQELRVVEHARFVIRFFGRASASSAVLAWPDLGGFGDLARQVVLNPEQVEGWRVSPSISAAISAFDPGVVDQSQPRYRITVREAGLYRLTYDMLTAAGVSLAGVDPRQLRVFHGFDELAIEVVGEGDGRFDPADEIRFYGESAQSLYTDTRTYWLVLGTESGRRMTQRTVTPQNVQPATGFPATQQFEVNRLYRSNLPPQSGVDHWFWNQMYIIGMTTMPTLTLPFTIEHVLPAGEAFVTPELWGVSSDVSVAPDHRVKVFINNTQIASVTWDGVTSVRPQLPFDQALLREGSNTLVLYTPGDTGARDAFNRLWESNLLNWFSITYQKAFTATGDRLDFTPPDGPTELSIQGWSEPNVFLYDVTDGLSPVRLVGALPGGTPGARTIRLRDEVPANARYHASTISAMRAPVALQEAPRVNLRHPSEGADYLLIAHSDFMDGVSALVQLRRDQGLRVRVINVQDIYDEFSNGQLDPRAIRDFIQYAYTYWPGPPPAYVLLVGDGSYDFMDYEGYGARTLIPPLLAYVDPILGETAADNRFVTVAGTDIMPDLHLGRLPVNNQAELAAMVGKIVDYELNPAPGPWRTRAVFVADNPDLAGAFGAFADAAAVLIPPEIGINKIYLGTPEYPVDQALLAQQATLAAFNQGALFFNYVGHSSISNWAAEQLFGLNVLPQVRNGSYYPIVLPMTCLEGSYHNPRFAGLSESIVRLSGRGAVASWGPTGLGVATGHDYLHTGFYGAVFNEGVGRLGPATTAAKLNLFSNAYFPGGAPRFHDLIDTYVLLGDPATRMALPEADLSVEATGPDGLLAPGDTVTFRLQYRNTGAARVKGVVVMAELPAVLSDLAWHADNPALVLRPAEHLMWDLAEMVPGATGSITITGQIPSAIPPGQLPLNAEMRIASPWFEPDMMNNVSGPLTLDLLQADLVLAQIVEPMAPIAPGARLTVTLGYTNLGPAAASGVALTLPLPFALESVQIIEFGPPATLRPGTHYEWELGALGPGSKGRLIVSGQVPNDLTPDQLIWALSSRISGRWPESDLANNVAEAVVIRIDVGDPFEPDNTRETARRLVVPALNRPRTYDPPGDQDWVVFRAQAGIRHVIRTIDLDTGGDTLLFLWDEAGRLVAKNDDAGPGIRASEIFWIPDTDQDFYAMVTSTGEYAAFTYGIQILALPESLFLPMAANKYVR